MMLAVVISRVGDSPIPGAGAYVDSKAGGAACTGDGVRKAGRGTILGACARLLTEIFTGHTAFLSWGTHRSTDINYCNSFPSRGVPVKIMKTQKSYHSMVVLSKAILVLWSLPKLS